MSQMVVPRTRFVVILIALIIATRSHPLQAQAPDQRADLERFRDSWRRSAIRRGCSIWSDG